LQGTPLCDFLIAPAHPSVLQFMTEWLQEVKRSHYEVILSTLLPHPPDFAKVGGQWERLSSRTEQMKEGKLLPVFLVVWLSICKIFAYAFYCCDNSIGQW